MWRKGNHYRKICVYRVPSCLPCVAFRAHGKHIVCRVPIKKHTAKLFPCVTDQDTRQTMYLPCVLLYNTRQTKFPPPNTPSGPAQHTLSLTLPPHTPSTPASPISLPTAAPLSPSSLPTPPPIPPLRRHRRPDRCPDPVRGRRLGVPPARGRTPPGVPLSRGRRHPHAP